jgi:hypothetical protein
MTRYVATFADGSTHEVKASKCVRTHAFKVVWTFGTEDPARPPCVAYGFAGSAALAVTGANFYTREARNKPRAWDRYSRKRWVAGEVLSLEVVEVVAS